MLYYLVSHVVTHLFIPAVLT